MAEKLQALKAAKSSTEFWANKEPKCPHCGDMQEISANEWYQLYDEGDHEVECPTCGIGFKVNTSVSYSFNTEEQDDA